MSDAPEGRGLGDIEALAAALGLALFDWQRQVLLSALASEGPVLFLPWSRRPRDDHRHLLALFQDIAVGHRNAPPEQDESGSTLA